MTVLLLDDRWPTLIPVEAYGRIGGPVIFTQEVPARVRAGLLELAAREGAGVLVSTNEFDPQVVSRIDAGEPLIVAESRRDPAREAVQAMTRACSVGQWEAVQTHRSLLPYLAEESQEFAEQVAEWERDGDEQALLKELGDLLLQVLFHSEIAARRGAFDFGEVARSFVDKLRSRSPYLFDGSTGTVSVAEQERLWAQGKAREKAAELPPGR